MTVLDFFCGAGGFSEGFQQAGFKIIGGFDNWEPAVNTYNHNFHQTCKKINILDLGTDVAKIIALPDTDIIIGSPPCVSFSSSNKSGKADKSLGMRLTEAFLRIISVKKFQSGSMLKYWVMENVPNSIRHLPPYYTFEQLDLSEWAIANEIDPETIAINIFDNHKVVNSAEFGSPQIRKRAIVTERVSDGKPFSPVPSHSQIIKNGKLPFRTLGQVIDSFPSPNINIHDSIYKIKDPNFNGLELCSDQLTDHFYDTGLTSVEWETSRFLKTNHPYMGRMSFPEDENKPSRTVTATHIGTSRESLIIKSRDYHNGAAMFRLPTVRESASLMGFPIDFQFLGGLTAKIRLVGNAVCPSVSRAYANQINILEGRKVENLPLLTRREITWDTELKGKKRVDEIRIRRKKPGARFRRHPVKAGGITVSLSNYDIGENSKYIGKWFSSVQCGTGLGFFSKNMPDHLHKRIFDLILKQENGKAIISEFNRTILMRLADSVTFQEMYEAQEGINSYLEPTMFISGLEKLIIRYSSKEELIDWDNEIFQLPKSRIPRQQLFAMYMINVVSTHLNTIKKTVSSEEQIETDLREDKAEMTRKYYQKMKII
ncbi:MAG: DNA cytosine methyltransferase [Bacteroidetes bacterium]|nr:DNA cytosine methyltransferase [Bacteroidota bacterium]